jgi:hypothetical protein
MGSLEHSTTVCVQHQHSLELYSMDTCFVISVLTHNCFGTCSSDRWVNKSALPSLTQ